MLFTFVHVINLVVYLCSCLVVHATPTSLSSNVWLAPTLSTWSTWSPPKRLCAVHAWGVCFAAQVCGLWHSDCTVLPGNYNEVVDGVQGVKQERWQSVCYMCHVHKGATVQCAHPGCSHNFHPLCARRWVGAWGRGLDRVVGGLCGGAASALRVGADALHVRCCAAAAGVNP